MAQLLPKPGGAPLRERNKVPNRDRDRDMREQETPEDQRRPSCPRHGGGYKPTLSKPKLMPASMCVLGRCQIAATGGCALGHARLQWCVLAGVPISVWSLQLGLCFCQPHVFWHSFHFHLPIPLAFSSVLPPLACCSCLPSFLMSFFLSVFLSIPPCFRSRGSTRQTKEIHVNSSSALVAEGALAWRAACALCRVLSVECSGGNEAYKHAIHVIHMPYIFPT